MSARPAHAAAAIQGTGTAPGRYIGDTDDGSGCITRPPTGKLADCQEREQSAITGGAAAALIRLLLSSCAARWRRRNASPIARMQRAAAPERTPV